MTSSTRTQGLAGGALALMALAGCGGHVEAAGSPAASPTTSRTSAPGASHSASPSAAPVPTASPAYVPYTQADLATKVLALDDLPAGYAVTPPQGDMALQASSKLAACKELVTLLNEKATPGALATTEVSVDGGEALPSYEERLDAFATPEAARSPLVSEVVAVRTCPEVSLHLPGYGRAVFSVAEISFGDVGSASYAARLSATSDDLDGYELLFVGLADDGVMMHVATDDDADYAADQIDDAVDKLHGSVSSGGSGSTT